MHADPRADPGQIHQVLLNLAINARDAMPGGGTLILEASAVGLDGTEMHMHPPLPAGRYARLVVADNGAGMPPDVVGRIFEPFFTTKPRGKGTGLGLATVYGIVQEARGSINVYSEPGVGTTFRVYLPLTAVTACATDGDEAAGVVPAGGGRAVLLVDDEPALAESVTRILTAGGYRTISAVSPTVALDLHGEFGCDLLLTDVIMPEMSGKRLADLLHERDPDLPVLFMSGYSDGLLEGTQLLDRHISFIEKPFAADALLRKVAETLTQSAD